MEWSALALGILALLLAILIGGMLALIVEGIDPAAEVRDERPYTVSDAAGQEAGDPNTWRQLGGDRQRADAEVSLPADGGAGVPKAKRVARR